MKKIDLKTFEYLLSVHGADLSRWPDVDAREVLAFIDDNADAKAQFAQAETLDAALAFYAVPEMTDADKMTAVTEGAIAAEALPVTPLFPVWMKMARRAGVGLAVCVALMIGGTAILKSRGDLNPQNTQALVVAAQQTATTEDIEAVLVIAAADIREQQQMQELLNLLKTNPDQSIDDAIDKFLIDQYTIDEQDILQMFSEG